MKRISQLDFFRGLFLVVMTAHHFMTDSNILYRVTNEFIGWITAAEGFFFLSGFTAGIVYGRLYITKGRQAMLKATKKRMITIYLHYLAVAFLISVCLYRFSYMHTYMSPDMPKLFENKTLVFLLTPVLLYFPPLFDILPSYLLFFAVLPFAIRTFYNGKAWLILGLSILLYTFGFFYLGQNDAFITFRTNHMPRLLTPPCWQLLFVLGVYAGYLFFTGKLQKLAGNNFLFIFSIIVSASFFAFKHLNIVVTPATDDYWFNKVNMGPLRVLNFASLTLFTGYLCSKNRSWFTYKPLCFLGKYSLEVFSFHILVNYFLCPVLPHLNRIWAIPFGSTSKIYPFETILLIPVILSLFTVPYLFLKRRPNVAGLKMALNHIISHKL